MIFKCLTSLSGQSDNRQIAVYISAGYHYYEMHECGSASFKNNEKHGGTN